MVLLNCGTLILVVVVCRAANLLPICRQDRAVELKGEWEASEKGRAERAKAARDKYLAPPVAEEEQSLGPKARGSGGEGGAVLGAGCRLHVAAYFLLCACV